VDVGIDDPRQYSELASVVEPGTRRHVVEVRDPLDPITADVDRGGANALRGHDTTRANHEQRGRHGAQYIESSQPRADDPVESRAAREGKVANPQHAHMKTSEPANSPPQESWRSSWGFPMNGQRRWIGASRDESASELIRVARSTIGSATPPLISSM
jgi:hypothetical protein